MQLFYTKAVYFIIRVSFQQLELLVPASISQVNPEQEPWVQAGF